jgi:hypothetical protein
MSYLLAICYYRQRKVGDATTNWPAVLELVNATFPKFPSFARSFPNGLAETYRLQSNYNARHRPNDIHLNEYRNSAWVLEYDQCTLPEQTELIGHLEDLIEAERVLSLRPGSSVVRNIEDPPVWWIEYNVTNSVAGRRELLHQRSEPEGEEMEEDGEGDQRVGQDEKATAESKVPSNWRSAPYEAFAQLTARRDGLGDHAAPIDHAALETSAVDSVPPNEDRNVPHTADTATGLGKSDHKENDSKARDALDRLVGKLHSWPELPMVHTEKVEFTSGKPTITIGASSFGRREAEEISVGSTSPVYSFASRVYKVDFTDEATGQTAEVDLLLCSVKFCGICYSANACLAQVIPLLGRQRPVIHEDDIRMVASQGPTFAPGGQSLETNNTPVLHSYVLHVAFAGGKRILVDFTY